jgi:hypothetical protein
MDGFDVAGSSALALVRVFTKLSALGVVYGGFRHWRVLRTNPLQEPRRASVPGWLALALRDAKLPRYARGSGHACWDTATAASTFYRFSLCDGSQLPTYRDNDFCSCLPSSKD